MPSLASSLTARFGASWPKRGDEMKFKHALIALSVILAPLALAQAGKVIEGTKLTAGSAAATGSTTHTIQSGDDLTLDLKSNGVDANDDVNLNLKVPAGSSPTLGYFKANVAKYSIGLDNGSDQLRITDQVTGRVLFRHTAGAASQVEFPQQYNLRASNSVADSITSGVGTDVIFNTEDAENPSGVDQYNNSTGIFTVPTNGEGVYLFCAGIQLTGATVTRLQVGVVAAGTNFILSDANPISGNGPWNGGGCVAVKMAAAQTAKVSVFATGTTLLIQNGTGATWFTIAKIQ